MALKNTIKLSLVYILGIFLFMSNHAIANDAHLDNLSGIYHEAEISGVIQEHFLVIQRVDKDKFVWARGCAYGLDAWGEKTNTIYCKKHMGYLEPNEDKTKVTAGLSRIQMNLKEGNNDLLEVSGTFGYSVTKHPRVEEDYNIIFVTITHGGH